MENVEKRNISSLYDKDDILLQLKNKTIKIVIPNKLKYEDDTVKLLAFFDKIKAGNDFMDSWEEACGGVEESIKEYIEEKFSNASKITLTDSKVFQNVDKIRQSYKKFEDILEYLIKENIEKIENKDQIFIKNFLDNFNEKFPQSNSEFIILVLPEAFFNYLGTPSIGSFIPFKKELIQSKIKDLSENRIDTLFVYNAVSLSTKHNLDNFNENIDFFKKESSTQNKLLDRYDYKKDGEIKPIFNESFILHKGYILHNYKKVYILQEDVDVNYLSNTDAVYIPGLINQKINNYFKIFVCQDWQYMSMAKNDQSIITFVQAAGLGAIFENNPLFKDIKYSGLFIHADIDSNNEVLIKIKENDKMIDKYATENFDVFTINANDINKLITN